MADDPHTPDETAAEGPGSEPADARDPGDHEVPSGATELLRDALVDDDDPRFPIWLPLPGALAAAGWALYQASSSGDAFLATLLWPGVAIFLGTTLASWLGWQLDID